MKKVAVIGAGLAGLSCARRLTEAGVGVDIFEKSRGVGGRLATRRRTTADGRAVAFDHGAPTIDAAGDDFKAALGALEQTGAAARWRTGVVGVPGMSGLLKPWLGSDGAGPSLLTGARITRVARDKSGWRLQTESGDAFEEYDTLAIAVPAPQAAALIGDHIFAKEMAHTRYSACFSVMAAFTAPLGAAGDAVLADGRARHPILAKAVCNSAKPGRAPGETGPQCWVLYADEDWSAARLEDDPQSVIAPLLAAFCDLAGAPGREPVFSDAHRWRYSRVARPVGDAFAFDASLRLGLIGDWRLGARAEDAYASGAALAAALFD